MGTGSKRAAGAVTGTYRYDVFGAVRTQTSVTTEWSYTGEQNDPTVLEYLRARYYDPGTGRFLSQDPLPLLQRYPYAGNNPTNFIDPSGLYDTRAAAAVLVAAAATAGPGAAAAAYITAAIILRDPCWITHAFCPHPPFNWKATANAPQFIRNAPVTAVGVGWALKHGGDCSIGTDLFITCTDMSGGYGSRSGMTIGNVFLTGRPLSAFAEHPGLLAHEKRHATQWAVLGFPTFPVAYFLNEAAGGVLPGPSYCWNVFEWDAGFKDGDYGCKGFGRAE